MAQPEAIVGSSDISGGLLSSKSTSPMPAVEPLAQNGGSGTTFHSCPSEDDVVGEGAYLPPCSFLVVHKEALVTA